MRSARPKNCEITLLSETAQAGYSGMMPGVIAGHYRREEAEVNVPQLCQRAGVRFIETQVLAIEASARCVHTHAGKFDYGFLSINAGSHPWMPPVMGGLHLSVKPFAHFLSQLPTLSHCKHIVIVGGGAASVEVLLALAHRLGAATRFTLVSSRDALLPGYPSAVVASAQKALNTCGADLRLNVLATACTADGVRLNDGAQVACDASVWATFAQPQDFIARSDFAHAPDGFIAVDQMQRSTSHATIFAVGDCASRVGMPTLVKAGVVPVRQGPWLHAQLCAALNGQKTKPFVNKKTALALLALGGKTAVGYKGGVTFSGDWVWTWKDWIDRRFMRKYD